MNSERYRSACHLITCNLGQEPFSGQDLAALLLDHHIAANPHEIDQIGTLLVNCSQIRVDDPNHNCFQRSNKKQYRYVGSSVVADGEHCTDLMYDLVIIGGGYAGVAAGYHGQYLGLNTALIHEPHSRHHLVMQRLRSRANDCHVSHLVDTHAEQGPDHHSCGQIWDDLDLHQLGQIGCNLYAGSARFTSTNTIQVGKAQIRFRKAVIATGSIRTASLMSQLDQCLLHCMNSDRIVIIGSSRFPRSLEICSLMASVCSRVVLLCRERDLISGLDPDHNHHIQSIVQDSGVHIIFISKFVRISDSRLHPELVQFLVLYLDEDGQARSTQAHYVIDLTENRPNIMDLDLELAGVKYSDSDGIQVDDYYVTSNRNVCAVGDCITSPYYRSWQLAQFQGQDAVTNAFIRIRPFSNVTIPVIIDSVPKIAHVVFDVHSQSSLDVEKFREPIDGGFVEVFVDSGSGRVVSAFAIGVLV